MISFCTLTYAKTETFIINGVSVSGEEDFQGSHRRLIKNAKIKLSGTGTKEIIINFNDLEINKMNNIVKQSHGNIENIFSFKTELGDTIVIREVYFKPGGDLEPGLYFDGKIILAQYEFIGSIEFTDVLYKDNELVFNPDNRCILSLKNKTFVINSYKLNYNNSRYEFNRVALYNPDKNNPVLISKMNVRFDGRIEEIEPFVGSNFSSGELKYTSNDIKFEKGKFYSSGVILHSGFLEGVESSYENLEFTSKGLIENSNIYSPSSHKIRNMEVKLESVQIVEGLSKLSNLYMSLPHKNSKLDLFFEYAMLKKSGEYELNGVKKLSIMGKEFFPDIIKGNRDILTLSGNTSEGKFLIEYNSMGFINSIIIYKETDEEVLYSLEKSSAEYFYNLLDNKDLSGLSMWTMEYNKIPRYIRGNSILKEKIAENDLWAVKWLLDNGWDLTEFRGLNPLVEAIYVNEDIVELLLKYDCDVINSGYYNFTVFEKLIETHDYDLLVKGINGGVKPLVNHNSPLHRLINDKEETDKFISLYLSLGFSPKDRDKDGVTVIAKSIESRKEEFAINLVKYCELDTLDTYWEEVIFSAVKKDMNDLVKEFFKKGVSTNIYDKKGKSLYSILNKKNDFALLDYLKERGLESPMETSGNTRLIYPATSNRNESMIASLKYDKDELILYSVLYRDKNSRQGELLSTKLSLKDSHIKRKHGMIDLDSNLSVINVNDEERVICGYSQNKSSVSGSDLVFKTIDKNNYEKSIPVMIEGNLISSMYLPKKGTTLILNYDGDNSYSLYEVGGNFEVLKSSSIFIPNELKAQKMTFDNDFYKLLTVTSNDRQEIVTLYYIDENLSIASEAKNIVDISKVNSRKEDIKRAIATDINSTNKVFLDDEYKILFSDDNSIYISKSNREFNTFNINKYNNNLKLLKSNNLNFHKIYDYEFLNYKDKILVISQGYSHDFPGLWIVTLNRDMKPIKGVRIPVKGYSTDVSAVVTRYNGLAIVYSFYDKIVRSRDHNYMYVKLDENLNGVEVFKLNINDIFY